MDIIFSVVRFIIVAMGYQRMVMTTMLLLPVITAVTIWSLDDLWISTLMLVTLYWILGMLYLTRRDLKALQDSFGQKDGVPSGQSPIQGSSGPLASLQSAIATLVRELSRDQQEQSHRLAEIAYSATELQRSSDDLAANTARQSDATASGASALVEMTQGVDNIAVLIREASVSAQQASDLATGSTLGIESATRDIRAMDNCADRTSQLMQQLSDQSRVVHEITDVIREISDQTNLLALNAAIEAARAGELGRGFAVVADEVRALARRSHQSADQISSQIQQVTQDIGNVVESMAEVRRLTACSVESTGQVSDSLAQIQLKTDEVSERVHSIASNTEQQSLAANEISQRIEEVHLAASDNSKRAEETARVALHLANLSQPQES